MIYVQVVCEIIIWSRVNLIWFGWRFTLLSILTTKQSLYLMLWFNSCRSRRLTLDIQLYCYRLQRDRDTGQPTTWHCVLFEIITCFHSIIISGQYSGTFWSREPASSQSFSHSVYTAMDLLNFWAPWSVFVVYGDNITWVKISLNLPDLIKWQFQAVERLLEELVPRHFGRTSVKLKIYIALWICVGVLSLDLWRYWYKLSDI